MYLRMLIWKDFRQQAGFLTGALTILAVPYVIAVGAHLTNHFGEHRIEEWYRFYQAASIADLMLSAVLVAFFAGNAIAGERSDGSAAFFAPLPVAKTRSTASKLAVSMSLAIATLALCEAIWWCFWLSGDDPSYAPRRMEAFVFFATCLTMFGVAWGVSSFVRSAAYAAAAGVCVPVCLGVTLAILAEQAGETGSQAGALYCVLASAVGLVSLASGTVYYLRRIEP